MRPSEIGCPSCGAQPGQPCRTIVQGVDTRWDHDTRILKAMFTDPPAEPDPHRDPAVALLYACTYCGASPGEPCFNVQHGGVLDLPHYSRTPSGQEG